MIAVGNVAYLEVNQIAATQFAVYGKIKQRKVPNSLAELKMNTDGPDVFQLQGWLTVPVGGSISASNSANYFSTGPISASTSISAFADSAGLHSSVSGAVSGAYEGLSALGNAYFNDNLNFNVATITPGYMSMTISSVGTNSGGGSSTTQLVAFANYDQFQQSSCYFNNNGNCNLLYQVDFSKTQYIQGFLNASVSLNSYAGISSGSVNETSFISGLRFTDLNGNPLKLSYTSSSGLTYPFATPIPEPQTYAMMLAGFGLLGFTARRRKNNVA